MQSIASCLFPILGGMLLKIFHLEWPASKTKQNKKWIASPVPAKSGGDHTVLAWSWSELRSIILYGSPLGSICLPPNGTLDSVAVTSYKGSGVGFRGEHRPLGSAQPGWLLCHLWFHVEGSKCGTCPLSMVPHTDWPCTTNSLSRMPGHEHVSCWLLYSCCNIWATSELIWMKKQHFYCTPVLIIDLG